MRHASRNPGRAAAALAILLSSVPVGAQIVNGSFEDSPDHLNGWSLGPGARVEALQPGNFAPDTIPVPDGSWYALISNGPGDVPGAPGGDFDVNGTNDFDSSTLGTTFTTVLPNETLRFDWAFLTDEVGPGAQGQGQYDDLFDITVDGVSILNGSVNKPGGISPFTDTAPYDSLRYTVSSAGLTNNNDFGSGAGGGRTEVASVCIQIANPGVHTLQFLVADQADATFDSALLVDAVEVGTGCNPMLQVTDSSGALLEVKGGGFVFSTVSNGRPAISDDGSALTYRSNGDYNGDNPNLQEQIWVATPNGVTYDIVRVTAAVGAAFGDPDISSGGQWLTFSSTADLAASNGDGNREIFRHDRGSGTFLQITNTSGCTNDVPTINDDGTRIAFESDCDFGIGTSGPEIVLWDGTFRAIDTSGCDSRDPRISRDAAGRYVTFVTTCDAWYPGLSNADGGPEILQWDTQTDLYLQVTDTPPGQLNDTATSSGDGRYIAFVSSANFEAGQNPAGDVVAFRYDRTTDSFLQLTDPDPLGLFTFTDINDAGNLIAVERLDVLTAAFDLFVIDAAAPRTLNPVVSGAPGVFNGAPAIAVSATQTVVAFHSDGNYSGGNPDANVEIWTTGTSFAPPVPVVFCSSPNLAIPDRFNPGVSDFLTVPVMGTIVDLDVSIRVEHPFVSDLRVVLIHVPTTTQARLIDRIGRPPGAGCRGDDIDATLDDGAATDVDDECVLPGPVSIQGTFRPDQALSIFNGEDMSGDWQLRISDRSRNNVGTLLEWCLIPATP